MSRALAKEARRIVVKVGSSVLTTDGKLRRGVFTRIAGQIAAALRIGEFGARPVERFLDFGDRSKFLLFRQPSGGQFRRAAFKLGQLFIQTLKSVFRGLVGLFLQGFSYDL